jgi:hypothetical protein
MNVSNFFKFIGEKFPQYELKSDNEILKKGFYKNFQDEYENDQISGDMQFSMPLGVPDKSTMDANGRNGKFIQLGIVGYDNDNEGYKEYEYEKHELHTNYINNVKDGSEILYGEPSKHYGDEPKKIHEVIYDNGKIAKKIYYQYFFKHQSKKQGPFISQVAHYDGNGDMYAIDHYRYLHHKEPGDKPYNSIIVDSNLAMRSFYKNDPNVKYPHQIGHIRLFQKSEDKSKPNIYFDLNGNEISREEYNKISTYI